MPSTHNKGWYYDAVSAEFRIPLTKGQHAVVDEALAPWLAQWDWYATPTTHGRYYADRTEWTDGLRHHVPMHRAIAQYSGLNISDKDVDHYNLDRLDNRLANLRAATDSENQWNRGIQRNSTSGFKGVTWRKDMGKWQAKIQALGKTYHLGFFETAEEAHRAYCSAAQTRHGSFARVA